MQSWQELLSNSLEETKHEPSSRFFQLASVDQNGLPHNRTVVLRHIDIQNGRLEIVTDFRSEKCRHLTANSHVAICWYFAETREQFRFACQSSIVGKRMDEHKIKYHWQNLSVATRSQFFEPTPGLPISNKMDLSEAKTETPPSNFVVIQLEVKEAEYLNVSESPHLRVQFSSKNDNWHGEQVFA